MTPLEIIRQAQAATLTDEDGHVVSLELLPYVSYKVQTAPSYAFALCSSRVARQD
jgi:hypothetical protein